jgi:hypothetical protein
MSVDEKLIDELATMTHAKCHGIADMEHIKNAIPIHLDRFFKSVVKSAMLMKSTLSSSTNDESDSSQEMWESISQSRFVSYYEIPI